MSKNADTMTISNEEIDRLVALVEGWKAVVGTPLEAAQHGLIAAPLVGMVHGWQCPDTGNMRLYPPRYSTDWAWCGPLVEKYGIEIRNPSNGEWWAMGGGFTSEDEPTPQRAICMAVVDMGERGR